MSLSIHPLLSKDTIALLSIDQLYEVNELIQEETWKLQLQDLSFELMDRIDILLRSSTQNISIIASSYIHKLAG